MTPHSDVAAGVEVAKVTMHACERRFFEEVAVDALGRGSEQIACNRRGLPVAIRPPTVPQSVASQCDKFSTVWFVAMPPPATSGDHRPERAGGRGRPFARAFVLWERARVFTMLRLC